MGLSDFDGQHRLNLPAETLISQWRTRFSMFSENCQQALGLWLLKQQTVVCCPLKFITPEIDIVRVGSE